MPAQSIEWPERHKKIDTVPKLVTHVAGDPRQKSLISAILWRRAPSEGWIIKTNPLLAAKSPPLGGGNAFPGPPLAESPEKHNVTQIRKKIIQT